jgi:hypothetical protein
VPATRVDPPAVTVAVMVNADPFAALEGLTVRVVDVAVWATAREQDRTRNNIAHKGEREFFWNDALPCLPARLRKPNDLAASPKICGDPIASARSDGVRSGSENKLLAAVERQRRKVDKVAAERIDWQQRSKEELREASIKANISNLSVIAATEIRLPIDHLLLIPEAIGWPPRCSPQGKSHLARAGVLCAENFHPPKHHDSAEKNGVWHDMCRGDSKVVDAVADCNDPEGDSLGRLMG